MKYLLTLIICAIFISNSMSQSPVSEHPLVFNELAETWDEGIPLGNGHVGNLVWQKDGKLRFSLDRADLWDLRPMESIDFDKWKFQDVYEHWKADTYKKVQKAFDEPYNRLPAPSKIPAGALEFNIESFGKVKEVRLNLEKAYCFVEWENGVKLTTFVHAEKSLGWYKFENLDKTINIELISPAYNRKGDGKHLNHSMSDLDELGYPQGEITKGNNSYTYNQSGWGGFSYQINTRWGLLENTLVGCWSVTSKKKNKKASSIAKKIVNKEINIGLKNSRIEHERWWKEYWNRSMVSIPNELLEKQYYMEMYKFGAAARDDAPPIALQAVWTADNGKLPPWKGDFHHDLNTQLSYWPSYTGNHLALEEGFINWLWEYRSTFKKYTKDYFEVEGMNVPGVTTLEGEPLGGWIQYSFGQTPGAWLGHHFYLHWKYSMDRAFLENKAYPWISDVAVYFDHMAVKTGDGKRKLKMSSSPEIFENSREAWFADMTNFDLALIRWTYEKATELALELGKEKEAEKWKQILSEWPELSIDAEAGLNIAPGLAYESSHRHFSHLLGFHPLGSIDFSNGDADQQVILNTLNSLEKNGVERWTGYSFSWLGNLYARAFDGEKAVKTLTTFSKHYCLKNSFHVNSDQRKSESRPFTLEGNFAFASALQEMLIQSHTGVVKLFPAIPEDWNDSSFRQLRAQGAFLVSSRMKDGKVELIEIESEKGEMCRMANPWKNRQILVKRNGKNAELLSGEVLEFSTSLGEKIELFEKK